MPGKKIVLALLQPVEAELCAEIGAHIETIFHCRCVIKSVPLALSFAYDAHRKQYNATPILTRAKRRLRGDFDLLLAVVNEDIFAIGSSFIFGIAEVGGPAAIISLARLQDEKPLLPARARKEAVHELGHVFGLTHCERDRCVMYFSNTLADTDHKLDRFCADCAHTLALKLIS